jgi:hypothetical protein
MSQARGSNQKAMKDLLVPLSVALLIVIFSPANLEAQNAQGTVLGHVTDPSGAPVQGARLTLTNVQTSVKQAATSSSVGDYVFVNIQPGTYKLTAEVSGFKTQEASDLHLGVDQTLRQSFTLSVGAVTEQVSVQANAQLVQTDNTTIGTTFTQQLIEELPINGRDITNLLRVQAGAAVMGGGPAWAWTMHGLNTDYLETSINGARPESVSYLIDGLTNNDQFFASPSNLPSSFAVSEFKAQDGLYSAEYGQGSAQVNIAVHSGTNQYHGNAYDFLQNDFFQPENPTNKFLNAQNPTATPLPVKDLLKQNQFGFTLGGPLVIPKLYNGRNRTFWFFSDEYGLKRQAKGSTAAVLTAPERTGNFSDWPYPIYDPLTTGSVPATAANPTGRQAFPNNQIPSSRIDPIAQNMLTYVPSPNSFCSNPCTTGGNFLKLAAKPWDTNPMTMRVDQNFRDRDRLFFTGIIGDQLLNNDSIIPLSGEVKYTANKLFGLNWQHTFTPNIINEVRVGYNNLHFQDGSTTSGGPDIATQLGFKNVPQIPQFFGPPITSWSNYQGLTLGNGNSGWFQNNHIYQAVENLKFISGRHTMTFGAEARLFRLDLINGYGTQGSLGFNGAFTSSDPSSVGSPGPTGGNSFADFLLGDVQNASHPTQVPGDHYNVRGWNWNIFAQDDIRVTPNLTVNLGFRYEIPPAFTSGMNGVALDPANGGGFLWADKNFVQQVSSAPGVNQNLIRCCAPARLISRDWKDFAPRVGLAWRPFASDRFVIRAGYGIFYDIYSRYYELTTYDDNILYTAPNVVYPNILGDTKTSPVQLRSLWEPFPPAQDLSYFQRPGWQANNQINWPDNRSPRTQQWTFDTQFALNQSTLLDVGYVGSRASHQNGYWYFNAGRLPAVPGDACNIYRSAQEAAQASPKCLSDPNFQPANTRNDYPNIGVRSYANANIFWSTYNALQVRLDKRLNNGFQYQLHYTFSKALDTLSIIGLQFGANSFIQDPHNIAGEYGPANFDQTHRFVATGSYEIPSVRNKWRYVIGGWQVSGIYTVSSGFPYTIYAYSGGNDQLGLTRLDNVRANLVGNPSSGQTSIFQEFNTAAFAQPELGTFGNLGRNTMQSPFYTNLDMAFGKNFRFSERAQLKYKLEVFNLTSTWRQNQNLIYPNNNISNSPANCTPGPSGNCSFGSLVPLNGAGELNLFNPRFIQMSLNFVF